MKNALESAKLEQRRHWAQIAVNFVRSIGIPVALANSAESTEKSFLGGVRIANGALIVDLDAVWPGDILHDAGHLAVIPAYFRPLACDRLKLVFTAMGTYLDENPDGLGQYPEDVLTRGIMQCSDPEATAWQFAAAHAINLPDKWLFPRGSFGGGSRAILQMLRTTSYAGINGLQAAGWTLIRKNNLRDTPVYPNLAFWLHPGMPINSGAPLQHCHA